MRTGKIELGKYFSVLNNNGSCPYLDMYIPDNMFLDKERKRPAVVICPGGAYIDLSDRESEPIAMFFVSMGFAAFVLNYSTDPHRYPSQLLEGMASVTYIRRNAEELGIADDKIFVCGFSAGGHLAGSIGVLGNRAEFLCQIGAKWQECRPDGMILCYPVIDDSIHSERINCFDFLTGKESSAEIREEASLSRHVSGDTPPAFIWHTLKDATVPVKSSIEMADALERNGVVFELHIFSTGPHGLSLCNHQTASADMPQYYNESTGEWKTLLKNWLSNLFDIKI
ncbi:MAG: alpha/beta hydrolase [Clostridia bacterium]|nr:alpha/beta hydrolase [Clostridia bacterium]